MSFIFLRCVGKAVLRAAPKILLKSLPFGEALLDVATEAMRLFRDELRSPAARRADVEAIARATPEEIRKHALAVVASAAPELRQPAALYLERVPSVIRRSLSRPEDPSGRTVARDRTLDSVEEILPFLPPRPPLFKSGDRPAGIGDWTVLDLLGAGGFGEVWRGVDGQNRVAALKFCTDEGAKPSLRKEADLLRRIQAENRSGTGLVPLLEYHLDAATPCLVFEYVSSGELTRLIRYSHKVGRGPVWLNHTAVRLLRRLAVITGHAHGLSPAIVHRDLKPSNILLSTGDAANRVRPMITDFGIGDVAANQALSSSRGPNQTKSESLMGAHTPLYASPEQREGNKPATTDDVYALGVIGYQILTGDTTSAPPKTDLEEDLLERGVPESVSAVLKRCLTGKVERRIKDATVLAEELDNVLKQMPKPSV